MLTYLIPTAKEMTLPAQSFPHHLSKNSSAILQEMGNLTPDKLAKAYKITEAAAQKEWGRWQAIKKRTAPAFPAALLFNGLMYRHLDRTLLTPDSPVYITSSFYGIIQALEPIAEHRHDFQTKVRINQQSLKSFWRHQYDAFAENHQTIVSLLSSEFSDVFSSAIRERFISISFMEDRDGLLKSHSTISKKARGAFLSTALASHAKSLEELTSLTFDGFQYRHDLSSATQLVFVKKN